MRGLRRRVISLRKVILSIVFLFAGLSYESIASIFQCTQCNIFYKKCATDESFFNKCEEKCSKGNKKISKCREARNTTNQKRENARQIDCDSMAKLVEMGRKNNTPVDENFMKQVQQSCPSIK